MNYEIRLRRVAQKELDDFSGSEYETLAKIISSLEQDSRPPRVKKLGDSGLWRVRIGHYRIAYAIDGGNKLVTTVRVAKRKEDTYRSL